MRKDKASPFSVVWRSAVFTAVLMMFMFYVPSPFVAYEPGIVEPVTGMVGVNAGDPPGQGEFLITTVRMSYANFLMVARSIWEKDIVLFRKKDILAGKSQTEFSERLVYVMQNSQSNAVEAVYRQLGIDYGVLPERLIVTDVAPQQEPGTFRPGDTLISVNGQGIKDVSTLARLLMESGTDQSLDWIVLRQREQNEFAFRLELPVSDPAGGDVPKALGGVQLAEIRRIIPGKEENEVTITAGNIGGPSAGLVFALQMVDRLTVGDLTGGLKVAGTGTIGTDGRIGPIGGISLKVIAAHRKGAQLFLSPSENVREAREAAASIGTSMRIEAVESLGQALEVLGYGNEPAVKS